MALEQREPADRVEELFSSAVERQIHEQRELNTLLASLRDAVDRLDLRLDRVEERLGEVAVTAPTVGALRESLGDVADSVRRGVDDRLRALEDGVAELRRLADERDPAARLRTLEEDTTETTARLRSLALAFESGIADVLDAVAAAPMLPLVEEVGARTTARIDDAVDRLQDRLESVRRATEAIRADSGGMRTLVERATGAGERTAERLATLGSTIDALRAAVTDGTDEEILGRVDALAASVVELPARVGAEVERTHDRAALALRQATTALEAGVGDAAVRLEATADRVDGLASGIEDRLEGGVARAGSRVREAAAEALQDLQAAGQRVDDTADRLRELEATLLGYLRARDEHVQDERRALVAELVALLAESLGRRERKRLANALADDATDRLRPHEPRPAGALAPADHRPHTAPILGRSDAASAPTPPAEPIGPVERRTNGGTIPVAPRPRRATSATAADGGATATDGPPSVRQLLGRVSGVGPAKQSAVIDAFGDLDTIAAATVDEVAAVPGISRRLAEAILVEVRRA